MATGRGVTDRRSNIVRLTAAAQALAAIETPTEAIGVIRLAEAARVYARQAQLGTDAENAATAIRLKAEIRLAEVVTEGQKRGEIAGPGGDPKRRTNVRDADIGPATLADIGVSRQRLSEAKDIARAIGSGEVDAMLAEASERGQTLSRTAVLNEVRRADGQRNEKFHERAEAALFTDKERARRALEPVLLSLVPTAQVIRTWKDYLTEQDRQRMEQHLASLVESLRRDRGLKVLS